MPLVAEIVSPDARTRSVGLDMVYRVLLAEAGFVGKDTRGRLYGLDPAEVASEALLTLIRRVEREEAGSSEKVRYGAMAIDGRHFRGVASAFVRFAAAHLCRGEQRHRRGRAPAEGMGSAADPLSFHTGRLADSDAKVHAVDVIRRMCSPSERKVVEALLASGWDTAQAASGLGVTTSYLYHTVRRLRLRLEAGGWSPDDAGRVPPVVTDSQDGQLVRGCPSSRPRHRADCAPLAT